MFFLSKNVLFCATDFQIVFSVKVPFCFLYFLSFSLSSGQALRHRFYIYYITFLFWNILLEFLVDSSPLLKGRRTYLYLRIYLAGNWPSSLSLLCRLGCFFLSGKVICSVFASLKSKVTIYWNFTGLAM